jgi:hypothetical protein
MIVTVTEAPWCWGEHFQAAVAADGETQRACESFEERFDLMMRRAAVEAAQVHVGFGGLCESLEKIFEKFNGEVADFGSFYFCVDDAARAAAEIDCGCGEGLVHGHQEISGAENAFF